MSIESTTLGGGCFWCLEAVYQDMKGVISVVSGYAGDTEDKASYQLVASGRTKHAEVVQIKYDNEIIKFRQLIEIFFFIHDPTTLNRQGNDVGPQYRSVVFYHNDEQKMITEEIMSQLKDEKVYRNPIVTEIIPLEKFFEGEDYHQNYYKRNPTQGYCRVVIDPKVSKFRKKYFDLLKN